jgi:hypothetical protein
MGEMRVPGTATEKDQLVEMLHQIDNDLRSMKDIRKKLRQPYADEQYHKLRKRWSERLDSITTFFDALNIYRDKYSSSPELENIRFHDFLYTIALYVDDNRHPYPSSKEQAEHITHIRKFLYDYGMA